MLDQQYPALWQFFGAYLHQDWREEYESTDAALRDFVSGNPDLGGRAAGRAAASPCDDAG